jgi:hypothetical protein
MLLLISNPPAANVGQDAILSHIQFASFQGFSAAEMTDSISVSPPCDHSLRQCRRESSGDWSATPCLITSAACRSVWRTNWRRIWGTQKAQRQNAKSAKSLKVQTLILLLRFLCSVFALFVLRGLPLFNQFVCRTLLCGV